MLLLIYAGIQARHTYVSVNSPLIGPNGGLLPVWRQSITRFGTD